MEHIELLHVNGEPEHESSLFCWCAPAVLKDERGDVIVHKCLSEIVASAIKRGVSADALLTAAGIDRPGEPDITLTRDFGWDRPAQSGTP